MESDTPEQLINLLELLRKYAIDSISILKDPDDLGPELEMRLIYLSGKQLMTLLSS